MRSATFRITTLALLVGAAAGCSRQLLSVVADVPSPPPQERSQEETTSPAIGALAFLDLEVDSLRPEIESVQDVDSVIALLPKDHAGNIDWVAARKDGIIRPRPALHGDVAAPDGWKFRFGFDFYLPGPNPTFDAWFPHSTHTDWVACEHCHSRIFRYRDTEIRMADVLQGKYCGECHGKVAFPAQTGCERCHRDLEQPPDRAEPVLLGTLAMRRVSQASPSPLDSADANPVEQPAADSVGGRLLLRQIDRSSLPTAIFPHWVHRMRFQCKVCHLEIFEPQAGANAITMSDIRAGRACGSCHDDRTAFGVSFDSCHRCHVPEEAPEQNPE